ncbi:hypothetical protein [Couchioplanes caeruleus]|uniref:Uncharacterized protein n=2 Tax=Couchioplanes caeruleus TaxID=56438 RepID=A0A1K0GUG4_9ACTN|nr:hypothetical protein [Couchioplanes caeruleus]OJF12995.1 hypothetical protein BG844_17635 [Couchioplanes caeruleus subsp. caeruleus]ROP33618.1 hypothetical protein EDD30_6634 [Couchioplanes caeruleus]
MDTAEVRQLGTAGQSTISEGQLDPLLDLTTPLHHPWERPMRLIMFNTTMGVTAGLALLLVPRFWAVVRGDHPPLLLVSHQRATGGWAATFGGGRSTTTADFRPALRGSNRLCASRRC